MSAYIAAVTTITDTQSDVACPALPEPPVAFRYRGPAHRSPAQAAWPLKFTFEAWPDYTHRPFSQSFVKNESRIS